MVKNDSGRPSRRSVLRALTQTGVAAIIALPVVTAAAVPPSPRPAAQRHAEQSGGFNGRAVDLATDQPVRGATITARPSGALAATGDDGAYGLSLAPGSYTLEIAAPGYIGITLLNQVVNAGYDP